jgi:propanediol dehydratase-reactivating factor small subunit
MKKDHPMTNEQLPGNNAKPVVRISVMGSVPETIIQCICWGLEEEGIPAEIRKVSNGPTLLLAKQAADASMLNVGICINGDSQKIVLHHRDLPGDKPLFVLTAEDFHKTRLRILGTNAARLVKGEPLVFETKQNPYDEFSKTVSSEKKESEKIGSLQQDQMEALVTRIVAEIMDSKSRG